MIGTKETMRNDTSEKYTYQDRVFVNEMDHIILTADAHYENMAYREAVKTGFYDLQAARDRYRDITATGDGMNWQMVERFIEVSLRIGSVCSTYFLSVSSFNLFSSKVQALMICPVCPHIAEHIWALMGKV